MLRLATTTFLAWGLSFTVLNLAASFVPLFDSSPKLSHPSPWPIVRWDTLHFLAITHDGYTLEHQWAFFPGTPFLLHVVGLTWWPLGMLIMTCASVITFYQLSLHHFPHSPSFARLAAFTSLFPTSHPTLYFTPYAEPFFTFLSYSGMLCVAKEYWIMATICFTAASAFRSNGTILAGYIVWGLIVHPFLDRKKIPLQHFLYAALLSAVIVSPFAYHNYLAYNSFCVSSTKSIPSWCSSRLPLIYPYVQEKYWNVGFLRYWTLPQIPNFLIAAPTLVLLFAFSLNHISITTLPLVWARFYSPSPHRHPPSFLLTPTIIPHVIHTFILCIILLFFSHTQIILRLSAALPTTYWAAAWLLSNPKAPLMVRAGSLWLWWSFLWGFTTLGLWVAFLPPA